MQPTKPARQAIIIPSSYDGLWRIISTASEADDVRGWMKDEKKGHKCAALAEYECQKKTV